MNYFVVTGVSRGFGRSIVERLASNEQTHVVGVARTRPDVDLKNFKWIGFDLSEVSSISNLAQQIFDSVPLKKGDSLFLINNAGVVNPIGPIDCIDAGDMKRAIEVNAVAPVLLSLEFLQRRPRSLLHFGIINISTGAAKTPYAGWSSYCSSKALLEMFTACASLENPNILIRTYNPGVIDTEMQQTLRGQSEQHFESVSKFIALHKQGKLQSPDAAAEKFVAEFLRDFL